MRVPGARVSRWAVIMAVVVGSQLAPSAHAHATEEWVTFSGRVLTAEGAAVPGVRVAGNSSSASNSQVTDTNGAFSLQLAPGTNDITLKWGQPFGAAFPPEELALPYNAEFRGTTTLTEGQPATDLTLPAVYTATAQVRDTRGDPVSASLSSGEPRLSPTIATGLTGITVTTIDEKSVSFPNTNAAGEATVRTFAAIFPSLRAGYTPPGSTTVAYSPPVDATITTDTTITLTVPAPPSAPASVDAAPADGGATVEWAPPTDDGGDPVSGYVVTATPPGPVAAGRSTASRARSEVSATTAPVTVELGPEARSTALHGLANGQTYTVSVRAANQYGPGPAAATTVTPTPQTTIAGTVTDEVTGQPVPYAGVAAVASTGRLTGATQADAAGHYSLPVPAGDYRVEFIDGAGRHTGEWYDNHNLGDYGGATITHATTGTTVTANAALAPAGPTGTIAGTITDTTTSNAIPGTWVIALRATDGTIVGGALTDTNGHYTITGLNPGNHHLAVIDPAMAHKTELFYQNRSDFNTADNITVTPGHTTTINANLDPTTP